MRRSSSLFAATIACHSFSLGSGRDGRDALANLTWNAAASTGTLFLMASRTELPRSRPWLLAFSCLERSGLIQELPFERMSRYEPNMDPHVNLVCIGCENVMDADAGQEAVVRLRNRILNESDFEVAWQRVDFYGWCPQCSAAKREQELTTA